jgi:hypothetical protein
MPAVSQEVSKSYGEALHGICHCQGLKKSFPHQTLNRLKWSDTPSNQAAPLKSTTSAPNQHNQAHAALTGLCVWCYSQALLPINILNYGSCFFNSIKKLYLYFVYTL